MLFYECNYKPIFTWSTAYFHLFLNLHVDTLIDHG